jgi:hypothetical protein
MSIEMSQDGIVAEVCNPAHARRAQLTNVSNHSDREADFVDPEKNEPKGNLDWSSLRLYQDQIEADDDDVVSFRFEYYVINFRKRGNAHLIPQILRFLGEGVNKLDYDIINIGENADGLDYDLEQEKLDSSNDVLSYYNMPVHLIIVSVIVFFFQIAVLAMVIWTNYNADNVVKARSPDLILVRIFISYYLSLQLADSMSMMLLNTIHEIIEDSDMFENSWLALLSWILMVPFWTAVCYIYSAFTMIWFKKYKLLLVAEVTLEIIMLLATAIITKQQDNILDSVFNFVGLLLILDLDELVVKTTSFTVKNANFKTGMKRDANSVKLVVSICFFIGIALFLLV